MTNQAPSSIKEGLASIRDLYIDYEISCDGRKSKVYRLILHLHSKVFAAASSGGFKEGQAGNAELPLPEHDPNNVQAMLDYFYKKRINRADIRMRFGLPYRRLRRRGQVSVRRLGGRGAAEVQGRMRTRDVEPGRLCAHRSNHRCPQRCQNNADTKNHCHTDDANQTAAVTRCAIVRKALVGSVGLEHGAVEASFRR